MRPLNGVNKIHKARIIFVSALIIISLGIITGRLWYIQIIEHSSFSKAVEKQSSQRKKVYSVRGLIYDCHGRLLTTNILTYSLGAHPNEIKPRDRRKIAQHLSRYLKIPTREIVKKLSERKNFVWLKRKLSPEVRQKIAQLKLPSLVFKKEWKRFYPHRELAAHVIGFVNVDNIGLEGLELYYNHFLRGKSFWIIERKDGVGNTFKIDSNYLISSPGNNLKLNLDIGLQYLLERELEKAYQKYFPKAVMGIILEPSTGKILALANRPTYNLNAPLASPPAARRNRCITDLFEPGSTFKIIPAAGILKYNITTLNQKIYCEKGQYLLPAGFILHDWQKYTWLSFREIIEYSSNIGIAKLTLRLGKNRLYQICRQFRLKERTGVDLPGERVGILRHPSKWSALSLSSISIGQELSSTALRLLMCYSVIANGGLLMRPYVVEEIFDSNGKTIKRFSPRVIQRVLTPAIASSLKEMLEGVVLRGTGVLAKIKGVRIAGKTGTAQKIDSLRGGYSEQEFISSFVGFFPVENPQVAILVLLDAPQGCALGGRVAAPLFKKVAEGVANYLNIFPETQKFTISLKRS
jgi:cell division protein FtsI (penicillin-binding protein 3)